MATNRIIFFLAQTNLPRSTGRVHALVFFSLARHYACAEVRNAIALHSIPDESGGLHSWGLRAIAGTLNCLSSRSIMLLGKSRDRQLHNYVRGIHPFR